MPNAAQAYRRQIELGLDGDSREASRARVILRDLLGPIQMCPEPDGSLWAQYDTRPAALVKKAVGASVELSGSGGRMAFAATATQLVSALFIRCYASARLGLDQSRIAAGISVSI